MPAESTVHIGVLLPDLLGTYGDRGNATVLAQRLRWRGHPASVVEVPAGSPIPDSCDVFVVGGGEDVAEDEAVRALRNSPFPRAVDRGAVVLAICAGMHLLGHWRADASGARHEALGLLDLTTRPRRERATGEIVAQPLRSELGLDQPLTGFENHGSATELGPTASPLARVAAGAGNGDGTEGVFTGRVVGTYLHGPVLARNPGLADFLLAQATGLALPPLPVDEVEDLRRTTRGLAQAGPSRWDRVRSVVTPGRWNSPGM